MTGRSQTMTVIVVPQTGKRTFSFRFAPLWLLPVIALLIALIATIAWLVQVNQALQRDLVELDDLKKVNRLQQAEIEAMSIKAQEAQQKLGALERLEQQIRELTGKSAPAKTSRGDTGGSEVAATAARGRGGPGDMANTSEGLPTLSAMLPPDVSAHLFTRRDTLPLHLRQISTYKRDTSNTLAQAEATNGLMEQQLEVMDQLSESLAEGKVAIINQLDYLAHRPTGLPVSGAEFTDRFGWRWSPFGWGRQFHNGLDLAQRTWTPIVATGAGVVVHAGWKSGGYGYTVIVDHGYGFETLYAHMVDWDVKVGQEVERGTRIGWVGSTGNSTGPHLHYEVHVNGVPVDPSKYLN